MASFDGSAKRNLFTQILRLQCFHNVTWTISSGVEKRAMTSSIVQFGDWLQNSLTESFEIS